jgi:hypothetical protein
MIERRRARETRIKNNSSKATSCSIFYWSYRQRASRWIYIFSNSSQRMGNGRQYVWVMNRCTMYISTRAHRWIWKKREWEMWLFTVHWPVTEYDHNYTFFNCYIYRFINNSHFLITKQILTDALSHISHTSCVSPNPLYMSLLPIELYTYK